MKKKGLYDMPWGTIAVALAMILSFVTIAIVVLYEVDVILTIEGPAGITIFDTWYQTLLFVVECVCGAGFIGCIVMHVLSRIKNKKNKEASV